jgi:hypothetical protein
MILGYIYLLKMWNMWRVMTTDPYQPEYIVSFKDYCDIKTTMPEIAKRILLRPYIPTPKFNSEDLILLAHDEWKRREERKHNHPEQDWVAGFLSGFCTSRRWAREYVDKLRQEHS